MSSQLDRGGATHTRIGGLAALTSGAEDAPPILLVPGYTGTKEDFAPILDSVATGGFRVVAIDLPGQYESPGPDDPDQYSTLVLGARVQEIAAELGPQVALLGHSFGGLVCRAAVIAAPEQFSSLVLMDSGPGALGGDRAALIEAMEPLLSSAGVAGVYDAVQTVYESVAGYVAPPPEVAAILRERFLAGSAAMLTGMGLALRTEPDRIDELRALELPTLVIYGVADDAWPPAVQDEMAARLGADVVRIPAAIHSPAIENPPPTAAALIRFWLNVRERATLES